MSVLPEITRVDVARSLMEGGHRSVAFTFLPQEAIEIARENRIAEATELYRRGARVLFEFNDAGDTFARHIFPISKRKADFTDRMVI